MKSVMVGNAMVTSLSRVLLLKRPDDAKNLAGKWVFPGGKFEDGDGSILDTAIRECKEETGFTAKLPRKLFSERKVFDTEPDVEYKVVYCHCIKDDKADIGEGEGCPVKWVTFTELSRMCEAGECCPLMGDNLSIISGIFENPHAGEKVDAAVSGDDAKRAEGNTP